MEAFIGTVIGFAGTFAPVGWELCDGKLLPINQNMALFSILGTTFGGDGTTNFALPKIHESSIPNMTYIICVNGIFPPRS